MEGAIPKCFEERGVRKSDGRPIVIKRRTSNLEVESDVG